MTSSSDVGATGCNAIGGMCWQTLVSVLPDTLALPNQAQVALVGVIGVGDPEATRTVYTAIVVLALLGVGLVALAIWVFRRTKPEPELLAPLEVMQTRGWRKLDPAAQRRSLDDSRPAGASPLRREASEPAVDSSFSTVAPVVSFDDLSGADPEPSSPKVDPDETADAVADSDGGPDTQLETAVDAATKEADVDDLLDDVLDADEPVDGDEGDENPGDGNEGDEDRRNENVEAAVADIEVDSVDDTEEIDDDFSALLEGDDADETAATKRLGEDSEQREVDDVVTAEEPVEEVPMVRSIDPLLAPRPLPSEPSA